MQTFKDTGDGRCNLAEETASVQGAVRGDWQSISRVEARGALYEHRNLAVATEYINYSLKSGDNSYTRRGVDLVELCIQSDTTDSGWLTATTQLLGNCVGNGLIVRGPFGCHSRKGHFAALRSSESNHVTEAMRRLTLSGSLTIVPTTPFW